MSELFPVVYLQVILDDYLYLLLVIVSIAVISLAYHYLVSVFNWNSMIDKRNADMGSSGWKYGKKGFWN